ncbi:hypothetical protein LTR78_010792 [Recurvomyces mirabilis]|uniref:Ysc84 actin-binding domain-containing protein n=1 Tax=Recurvomyces mirabilis TaxID=574656 RepID=A0AAE0TLL4_9PEZI|nr:hypothetical protein LTR78_010792 [Recurvomyces mirabilis]KAK5149510.1 hypothetical protein LTS14_010876 [Recurvomyces mirabilis]
MRGEEGLDELCEGVLRANEWRYERTVPYKPTVEWDQRWAKSSQSHRVRALNERTGGMYRLIPQQEDPLRNLAQAAGLAIFSAFRAGMYFAGTSGHGAVLARLADGTWSPPSAFTVKSGGVGLVYGVDVFDCIYVLNTPEAVEAYKSPDFNLGGRADFALGPLGGKANSDVGNGETVLAVWTYTRSKGIYGGVTLDGTVVKEQRKVNAEFYGGAVTVAEILKGEVEVREGKGRWPEGARKLMSSLESLG